MMVKCNKSGKYPYCTSCCHSIEHETVIDDLNKIPCHKLCCYDGKKYIKVRCKEIK